MHGAPAVSYPVGKSRWHLRAIIVLGSCGCVASFLFIQSQARAQWWALTLACLTLAVALALVAWRNTRPSLLRWDGQCWHWSGFVDASPCGVDVLLDLQKVILIRLSNACAQHTWLWLDSEAANTQWIALRRAVFGGVKLRGKERKNQDKDALLEP